MTKIASITDTHRVVDDYLAVWSEPDADRRRHVVEQLWTADGVEYVEGAQFRGHDQLTARVAEAHTQFIAGGQYRVTWGEDATVHDDIVTFTIQLIANAAPGELAWSARVFLVLNPDGHIREDYQLTVQPIAAP